jgi:hypothetical protein
MFDYLIPFKTHISRTLYDYKKFYTNISPSAQPDFTLKANGYKWSYEEYQDIKERLLKCFRKIGYEPVIYSIIDSPPPKQDYPLMVDAIKKGNVDVSLGNIDQKNFEFAQDKWEKTRNEYNEINKYLFNNKYLQCQIGVIGHEHDTNYPWCYLIKNDNNSITISFYPSRENNEDLPSIPWNKQNELIINEFCKFSVRYRLGEE